MARTKQTASKSCAEGIASRRQLQQLVTLYRYTCTLYVSCLTNCHLISSKNKKRRGEETSNERHPKIRREADAEEEVQEFQEELDESEEEDAEEEAEAEAEAEAEKEEAEEEMEKINDDDVDEAEEAEKEEQQEGGGHDGSDEEAEVDE